MRKVFCLQNCIFVLNLLSYTVHLILKENYKIKILLKLIVDSVLPRQLKQLNNEQNNNILNSQNNQKRRYKIVYCILTCLNVRF